MVSTLAGAARTTADDVKDRWATEHAVQDTPSDTRQNSTRQHGYQMKQAGFADVGQWPYVPAGPLSVHARRTHGSLVSQTSRSVTKFQSKLTNFNVKIKKTSETTKPVQNTHSFERT